MYDSANDAPTPVLTEHVRIRYHQARRQELPDLIALARKVEAVHADDINAPHGLTQALEGVVAALDAHIRMEEAIVFPALAAGETAKMLGALAGVQDDRDGRQVAKNRIAAITHGMRLPLDACGAWRLLYAKLGELAADLDEHMYLENDVLFSRLQAHA
ncbi:hemerythrin domain-containing protein [Roseovarius sp. S4756]|uniref:hemerythrin domain-containing protein n=1 Tax=Roseovarius maritimus TaxID=3342637 RepID=UPI0037269C6E